MARYLFLSLSDNELVLTTHEEKAYDEKLIAKKYKIIFSFPLVNINIEEKLLNELEKFKNQHNSKIKQKSC